MSISIHSILPFTTSVITLGLGLVVYARNKACTLNRIFLLWCFFLFIWLFNYSLCYSTSDQALATLLTRIASTAVMTFPIIYYHLIVVFLGAQKEKTKVLIAYAVTFLLLPFYFLGNHFITDAHRLSFGYYGKGGPLYIYTILVFSCILLMPMHLLIQTIRSKTLTPHRHTQAKYIMTGFAIAFIASVDFIPKFGYDFYPIGDIFILIWVIIMSYAILKHRLLDINIVLRRSLIYSLLITCLTVFYLIVIVIMEKLCQGLLGYESQLTSVLTTAIIAVTFIPVRTRIQYLIDKYFFKGSNLEIAEQNEQLRKEVAQTEQFKTAATLASSVAHEIKNPLTAIKTFFDHFPDKKNDPEFLEKFNRIVGHELTRIDDLVHNLMDFASPSPLKMERCNIYLLIQSSLNLLNNQMRKNCILVNHRFNANQALTIVSDPRKLNQAFINLLLNAIEAMPNGGRLTITTSCHNANILEITIYDTGCGVADSDINKIFEPFYSKKKNGTGPGLSITQEIIKEHGGQIKVTSGSNSGTEFNIQLSINGK